MLRSLIALILTLTAASAEPQTVRVVGAIAAVDAAVLTVKPRAKGEPVRVAITDNAAVYGVIPATLADIRPGAFIGVGAMPQADGSQRAIRVMIFAEPLRGNGEGHRPWSRPGTTMTNATVDTTVAGVDGQVLRVRYKGGEQRIVVGPDALIMAYVIGDRSELKPGANIAINAASRRVDGLLEASRVNVGRGDIRPD